MSDSAAPWTIARQGTLSMGFPRQEYWSVCHFLLQGIIPIHGSKQSPALSGKFFIAEPSGKPKGKVSHLQLKPSGRANVSSRNISGPLMNEDILSQAQIPLVNLSETTLSFENFRRMIFHCHQWRRPTLALLHI